MTEKFMFIMALKKKRRWDAFKYVIEVNQKQILVQIGREELILPVLRAQDKNYSS